MASQLSSLAWPNLFVDVRANTSIRLHLRPRADQQGQTFEGGISGRPDAEAHGAYAFCALACLAILDAPHRIIPK